MAVQCSALVTEVRVVAGQLAELPGQALPRLVVEPHHVSRVVESHQLQVGLDTSEVAAVLVNLQIGTNIDD